MAIDWETSRCCLEWIIESSGFYGVGWWFERATGAMEKTIINKRERRVWWRRWACGWIPWRIQRVGNTWLHIAPVCARRRLARKLQGLLSQSQSLKEGRMGQGGRGGAGASLHSWIWDAQTFVARAGSMGGCNGHDLSRNAVEKGIYTDLNTYCPAKKKVKRLMVCRVCTIAVYQTLSVLSPIPRFITFFFCAVCAVKCTALVFAST